ncbi:MAG: putative ABC transporter permease [Lachnospiraceae bacterium]|nr:putative ABC transporter permease [Lachnospiraceae bacterium]MCI9658070.1 putative ABC transporter permease [Lachnospiraceae bacterium]
MYSYHFREWLSFFYFYCIFGWCFESAYVSIKEQRLTNRGFLRGPWLPLYGSGAILVLWLTLPFQRTPVLVYVVGALGATALEYVTGVTMVRWFRVRYWDYSGQKFQYQGHICLSSSAAWGFLSLLMVYAVHRPVERLIFWMHEEVVAVMTFGITVCMVYDFSNAFRKAMDLRELLIQAEQLYVELEQRAAEKKRLLEAAATFAKAAVEEHMEEQKEELLQKAEAEIRQLQERQERIKEHMFQKAELLLARNPGYRFVGNVPDLKELRDRLRRNKRQ